MLNKIIENKRKEVELNKKRLPLSSFKYKLKESTRNFKKAISVNKLNLIAEIKRKYPSQNIKNSEFNINNIKEFDIKKIVKVYNKYADAISVLTDKKFFEGSLIDLETVSSLTTLPILRKDFIIDEYQIYESRLHNADAVLLIASILSIEQINYLIKIAKSYGMDCLVEVNSEEELNKVIDSNATIIGINNRNLNTLEVDIATTINLMNKIPDDRVVVSESGITSKDYLRKIESKVNAILVGSLFMNSANLELEIISLLSERICA